MSLLFVCFRRRAAFLSRITAAYVSRKKARHRRASAPPTIASTQNTQRQPFAATRKPPATGPMTGPSTGARAKIPSAAPRFSCVMASAIVPPPNDYTSLAIIFIKQTGQSRESIRLPFVIGAAPKRPWKNRQAVSMPTLLLSAHNTLKTMKPTLVA